MTALVRPQNKQIVDKDGRINLEWDAYFQRLEQLLATTLTAGVTSFNGRTGNVLPAASDYDADEIDFTPAGNIAATNAQTAIEELDTEKQPVDADLTALAALNSTGLVARTAAATYALRALTGPAAGVSVSNGNGVSGNPTIALANDLAALEALASTGLAARTAADTWAQRTITGTSNEIAVANGDGVSGNPTLSLPATIDLGGKTSLEIPNSATPTVDADGEIAVDTSVTDFSHGVLKYYGGEEMAVVAMPIAELSSPTDGYVVAYNATNDEFELVAPSAGGGATWTSATLVNTTSGTAITLVSGLPTTVREIEILLRGVGLASANVELLIQLGDSGGFETTGYDSGTGANGGGLAESTAGFILTTVAFDDADVVQGVVRLCCYDDDNTSWHSVSTIVETSSGNATNIYLGSGYKDLSAALTQIQITTEAGSQTFESGTISLRHR